MIIETGRFGQLNVSEPEIIQVKNGLLGFSDLTQYVLVDPGDATLIMWLQSIEKPEVAFPIIEPKIFKSDYVVKLSAADQRELRLEKIQNNASVFSILTIPTQDITKMTANIKAPIVINLENRLSKQVVLQENEYSVSFSMFKELKSHIITIKSQEKSASETKSEPHALTVDRLTPFNGLKSLV